MDKKLEKGLSHTLEKRVTPEESARQIGSGNLEVFSTPSMIAFMERAAMELVQPHLDNGVSTVGTLVNIRHLKPTPVNSLVKCMALLTDIDGKKLTFSVEVKDEFGTIGSGIHERFIIDEIKFISKLLT